MPIGQKKQCQTLINIYAGVVVGLQAEVTKAKAVRQKFIDRGVNPSAHPALAGHATQLSNWVDAVDAVATNVVAQGLLAARVPSHRNLALEET